MLKMKYILNEDGTVTEEQRSFPIKQKESGNILIEIAVPASSLLYPVFQEQGVAQTTTGSSVQLGSSMIADTGELVKSSIFFAQFIKNYTDPQNRPMKLFQRRMPNAFVLWAGTTTMTLAAVNLLVKEDEFGTVISQEVGRIHGQVTFPVEPSSNTDDVQVDPSEATALQVQINDHQSRLNDFEDWKDNNVDPKLTNLDNRTKVLEVWRTETVDPTLHDHESRLVTLEGRDAIYEERVTILENQQSINTQDIATIREQLDSGMAFLGTIISTDIEPECLDENGFPLPSCLDNFVLEQEGRERQSGDKFYFVRVVEDGTDTLWTISFSTNRGWQAVEIPPLEAATNQHLGSIRGTFYVGTNLDCVVDINAGQILRILIKNRVANGDGSFGYTALRDNVITLETLIKVNADTIAKIIAGTQTVGMAEDSEKLNDKFESELEVKNAVNADKLNQKFENELDVLSAKNDQNQESIVATYRRKDDSYSARESDLRFSRRTFNQNFFISSGGLSVEMPTIPPSGVQFSTPVSGNEESQIMRLATTLENPIVLTSQQTIDIRPYLNVSDLENTGIPAVAASARIVVAYKKVAQLTEINVADISDSGYTLTYGVTERLDTFETGFNLMTIGDEVELDIGDEFIVYLFMTFNSTNAKQVDLITNTTYPSSINFVSDVANINIINDRARLYEIQSAQWTLNGDIYEHQVIIDGNPLIVQLSEFTDVTARRMDGTKAFIDLRVNSDGTVTLEAEQAEDLTAWIIGGVIQIISVPAATENLGLSDPNTESPSGTATSQKEVNQEVTAKLSTMLSQLQLRFLDGVLQISYDNGVTWTPVAGQ